MDIKGIIQKELSRPDAGGRIREAVETIKEVVHVRQCNEADCPRCDELGFNGSGTLRTDRQSR